MKAKEPRISVRVDRKLKDRLDDVCSKTGIDEADLVRNCILALCDSAEKNGTVTFPVKIVGSKIEGCGDDAGCVGIPGKTDVSLNERGQRYRCSK